MKQKVLLNIALVIAVLVIFGFGAFKVETKQGLDLKGGVYIVLKANPIKDENGNLQPVTNDSMIKLKEIMDRRINGLGVSEPVMQISGTDRLIIEIPGVKDAEEAIKLIGKTALLEFKLVREDGSLGDAVLTGKSLVRSDVTYDNMGKPQIAFELNASGAEKFAAVTRENVGRQLAIVLDGEVQTSPKINSEIPGGRGVITGNYTTDEAKKMSTLLNAGALPVAVEILETRTVGATLGKESIDASFKAGLLAFAFIGVFMLVLYGIPGMAANIALAIYGIVVFGSLNFIESTLTLPGIAGFILSLGMAVDINVLLFERMKEEMKLGNTVLGSVDAGFKKAFSSIFDGNMTTLLITSVLITLGTGPIKGFAVILTIGVLASLFTSITLSRFILKSFIHIFKIENPIWFGVRRAK
jgi:preprotein translocase subunit SecD